MIDRQIMRRLLLIEDFPTLPEVLQEILNTVDNEGASAASLTTVVERDHAISVRVLRIANSAFYGLRHHVNSLRAAVVALGFNAVRLLALATSVFDALSTRDQFALDPQDFWMHSFGTAKAAQILARLHRDSDSVDACFTAGLIHDMGKYLLALALKDEYRRVVEAAGEQRRPLRELEAAMLGTTSAEVGGWLAERWGLPPRMIAVVGDHHKAAYCEGPYRTDVITVALADQLAAVAGFGLAGEYGGGLNGRLVHLLELSTKQLSDSLEEARGYLEETRRFVQDLGTGGSS